MEHQQQHHRYWIRFLTSLTLAVVSQSLGIPKTVETKSSVFLSPTFELEPGSVENKYYFNIDFPKGHVALKSFDAEVVDGSGNPVPLHEAYLHHWFVMRYHVRKELAGSEQEYYISPNASDLAYSKNGGPCQGTILRQIFGLGSETRRTQTDVPDPYGIETGRPDQIPEGFVERWMLNVHAIDTRGAVDRLGCTECRCDLYNVTVNEFGRPLPPGYRGGLSCCRDQTRCRVRDGFHGPKRSLFLRYTVRWLDWSHSVLPVRIFIFDVTDDWKVGSDKHKCKVEYEVEQSCDASHSCVHTKKKRVRMPRGGHVVYAVAHQHTGGVGSTLYGEDGRVICESNPMYGKGVEPGNEKGFIVGMSTCYPEVGSAEIVEGETLTHESRYNSSTGHTGVMALFYIILADSLPNPNHSLDSAKTHFSANMTALV